MIGPLLLALASAAVDGKAALPCLPEPRAGSISEPSDIGEHEALRAALGEPMPQADTVVMLYGRGGHLSTSEYSVILARGSDGLWRGTAVGRSRIWVDGAPYTPMDRADWVLDTTRSQELDEAIARRCPARRVKSAAKGPPPLGHVAEVVDVRQPKRPPVTFYVSEGTEAFASLIRPPR